MYAKKYIISGLIIVLLLVSSTIFSSCGGNYMSLKDISPKFYELIESGNLNYVTLNIYYKDFWVLTRMPVTLERLIGGWYDYKVTVFGEQLKEHLDLLNRLSNTVLIPVRNPSFVNARLYYVFEHEKYGEILSFLTFSGNNTIFINGHEVEHNGIFYEVAIPFLPDDAIERIEERVSRLRR